jgi:serine/threonine-protein kinase
VPDRGASSKVVGSILSASSPDGGWRLMSLCGRGGTAEVWRAVSADGREAALKRIRPDLRRDRPAADDLLRREHESLRSIGSPHVVRPLDLVAHDGALALVLEYLPNGDLVSLLGAPVAHWLHAVRGALAGLADLQQRGLAHGDVKARNVLFAADESVRLIDLSSARPGDAPAAVATPAYGLPTAGRATAREADCFAVGVLVYELVTGQLPYGPEGARQVRDIRPTARPSDAAAARLLAAATAMLEAGGGLPRGLSHFSDVIESVGAQRP